ncbi:DUF2235 domain-containing protein [Pseudohalocynthiibacter sp. F2068]|jgi:uncharacterized protein (DUF2235 family)|uniref:DUF2235 domain-containing protein n=1 Tax=Pseudohalocynthiibacter sp. F2068 TaxID=2926418 RepID=UPI001FF2516F|nr:DUF2235 domain-containing protein [Pseudohalocynthiibacter sp. F2068]MCK0103868.1 DUF2235 domain-containing protein [Pseudohalocynthiibacter sp. F2068]
MPKNIVILCDGTSNEISEDRTNVLRLYGTLKKDGEQLVYYDPGVGTFGAANSVSYYYRRLLEIWGLATGWGLDQNVKEAYRFLVEYYDNGKRDNGEHEEPDQIYIFGFSRGAYTARVLAGFIHSVGLFDSHNLNLLDYAYRAYKAIGANAKNGKDQTKKNPFAEVRLFERMLRAKRPAIRCLGLFDTVGSVIEMGRFGPRLLSHAFTRSNTSVEAIRHAVALDERRTMFHPQLWPEGGEYWGGPFQPKTQVPQDVNEVWFAGVHGDVGGGYPEQKSQLAKIPLLWMIDETKKLGLRFKTQTINEIVLGKNPDKHYVSPDPKAPKNKSMNLVWAILEFLPRKRRETTTRHFSIFGFYLPLFERRKVPDNANTHPTVSQR